MERDYVHIAKHMRDYVHLYQKAIGILSGRDIVLHSKESHPLALLYPRYEVYRGYIVFAFSVIMFVCLFVCLSV